MNTWFNNLKVKCAVNAKAAKIRALKRTIAHLQVDVTDTLDRIEYYKEQMAMVDGNQMDLFISEKR